MKNYFPLQFLSRHNIYLNNSYFLILHEWYVNQKLNNFIFIPIEYLKKLLHFWVNDIILSSLSL